MIPYRGQIVAGEGSAYTAPQIDRSLVERSEYVPHDLAIDKLKNASAHYVELKTKYDDHIMQLKTYHEQQSKQSKLFYEDYIRETKAKALKHIEIEKQLRKLSEDNLRDEIKGLEATIEDLRDTLANLKVEYQDAIRKLKAQVAALETSEAKLKQENGSYVMRLECVDVLNHILIESELSNVVSSYEERIGGLDQQLVNLRSELESQLISEKKSLQDLRTEFEVRINVRQECGEVLVNILAEIECAEQVEESNRATEQDKRHENALNEAMQLAAENQAFLERDREIAREEIMLREERTRLQSEDFMSVIGRQAGHGEELQQRIIAELEQTAISAKRKELQLMEAVDRLEVTMCISEVTNAVVDRLSCEDYQALLEEKNISVEDSSKTTMELVDIKRQYDELHELFEKKTVEFMNLVSSKEQRESQLLGEIEMMRTSADALVEQLHSFEARTEVRTCIAEMLVEVTQRTLPTEDAVIEAQKEIRFLKQQLENASLKAERVTEKFKLYRDKTEVRQCLGDVINSVRDRVASELTVQEHGVTQQEVQRLQHLLNVTSAKLQDNLQKFNEYRVNSEVQQCLADVIAAVCDRISSESANQRSNEQGEIQLLHQHLRDTATKAEYALETLSAFKTKVEVRRCLDDIVAVICDRAADEVLAVQTTTQKEVKHLKKRLEDTLLNSNKSAADLKALKDNVEVRLCVTDLVSAVCDNVAAEFRTQQQNISKQQEALAGSGAGSLTGTGAQPSPRAASVVDHIPMPMITFVDNFTQTEVSVAAAEVGEEITSKPLIGGGEEGVVAESSFPPEVEAAMLQQQESRQGPLSNDRIDELKAQLAELQKQLQAAREENNIVTKSKQDEKLFIKNWLEQFEKDNGRPAEKEDKEKIKEHYKAYKTTTSRSTELTTLIDQLDEQRMRIEKDIAELENISSTAVQEANTTEEKSAENVEAAADTFAVISDVDGTIAAAESGAAALDTAEQLSQDTQQRKVRIDELRAQLAELQKQLQAAREENNIVTKSKQDEKLFIKNWLEQFEKDNGRPAEKEDKEKIKEHYKAYKTTTSRAAELTVVIDQLDEQRMRIEKDIAAVQEANTTEEKSAENVEAAADTFAVISDVDGTITAESAAALDTAEQLSQDTQQRKIRIDELRAQLAELQKQLQAAREENDIVTKSKQDEKLFIKNWLEQFEKDNGRPAEKEDKEKIKEHYKAYKTTTSRAAELTALIDQLDEQQMRIEKDIAELENISSTAIQENTPKADEDEKAALSVAQEEPKLTDAVDNSAPDPAAVAAAIAEAHAQNVKLLSRIRDLEEEIEALKVRERVVVHKIERSETKLNLAEGKINMITKIQEKINAMKARIAELDPLIEESKASITEVESEKAKAKGIIKKWIKNFEKENGRPPVKSDKEDVKQDYKIYKIAIGKIATSKAELAILDGEKNKLLALIRYLQDGGALDEAFDALAAELDQKIPKKEQSMEEEEDEDARPTSVNASISPEELLMRQFSAASTDVVEAEVAVAYGSGQEEFAVAVVEEGTAVLAEVESTAMAPPEITTANDGEGHVNSNVENLESGLQPQEDDEKLQNIEGEDKKLTADDEDQKVTAIEPPEPIVQGPRPEDIEAIERLEDTVYQIQLELEETRGTLEKAVSDKEFLAMQVDALIKEKRTDLVKRYEDEIAALKASEADLTKNLTLMKTEKTKLDTKLAELKERAERAEKEIVDRDEREKAKLNPNDERSILRVQLAKQRDDIVMKAKAVAAGWDAAAVADERLDLDVDKAYRKGLNEGRKQHDLDMKALNSAIELKENRITELLVSVHAMEARVKEADERVGKAEEQARSAKLEAAETIANFGSGGGGASEAELDAARDEVDAAQEEIVALSEKVEGLSSSLEIAKQKMELFEQLIAVANASARSRAANMTFENSGGGSNIPDLLADLKSVLNKGTTLWKNNRRDECYDLYLRTCDDLAARLRTPPLVNPLMESTAQGRAQSLGGQNKARGAVVLRKALDRLLADLQQPANKRAEDEAAFNSATQEAKATQDTISAGLRAQIAILSRQEEAIKRNIQKAGASEGDEEVSSSAAQGSTEAVTGGPAVGSQLPAAISMNVSPVNAASAQLPSTELDASTPASTLLKRAKAAEAKIEMMKKQMAALAHQQLEGGGQVVVVVAGEGQPIPEGAIVLPAAEAGALIPAEATVVAANTILSTSATAGVGGEADVGNGGSKLIESKSAKLGPAISAGTSGSVNPAEVRRLQRRVKDLESQLESALSSGGGGDKKAAERIEKQLNKKIKDMETAQRKEKGALEAKLAKAEATLETATASLPLITEERDNLRNEVKELLEKTAQMDVFKASAARVVELEAQMLEKQKEMDLLQEQFKKETALRKKYKNELEDLKGAIRVYARCRPMAKYELERGCQKVVEFLDDTRLKVQGSRGAKEYEFDAAFSPLSTQDQVFEDTKRLVESFMDGFNVCLFAYGQTGSGKTFTMTGAPDNPGLTPKAIDEIFRLIDERKHCVCKVTTYFVELYNDNLVDLYWLLDNKKSPGAEPPRLEIKVDAKKMVYIRNTVVKEVMSSYELMDLFNQGNAERHTGATRMNAESSRSHSIFAIMVESYDTATKRTIMGKLSLVDLAGSERSSKTGASAERLREAQSINKSLSALGDVIAALSEGEKFIPYRNNKLTQLMQDSLGGNAKTLMFVNFSPADYNSDETITSLNYAARVKKIINNASKQAESAEVARLKAIIKRLQSGAAVDAAELEGDAPQETEEQPYDNTARASGGDEVDERDYDGIEDPDP